MPEQWLPAVGYEGSYEVSDLGRIRSLERTITYVVLGRVTTRTVKATIMQPGTSGRSGYRCVRIRRNDGRVTTRKIHTLVLEAFMGPRPEGLEACHGSGGKSDNTLSNLRWDTSTENNLDIVRHGNHKFAHRDRCSRGHLYTPENTYRYNGGRFCRECRLVRKGAVCELPIARETGMNDNDEWRDAVRRSTPAELEAAQDSQRAAIGLIGEADDDRY